ncbi:hypothetical protein DIS24_g10186 [Lasiodiplodia hormozganensis]|uniref:Uncharacterized protein n=1 Tax=Lasiodiplodia hormozganensis TaxID=869390 RepID=A0AA39XPY2_9PEZI|nr:hypothetical protein DIS24_g10186 [Lasiodiplodia hormozganensis]
MSETSYSTFGAPIQITLQDEGVYEVTQLDSQSKFADLSFNEGNYSIDSGVGPVKFGGFIQENSLEIGVDVAIFGLSLGSFNGNIKDGLVIKVNVAAASGEIKLFIQQGNCIMASVDLRILGQTNIDRTVKILTL